MMRRTPAPRGLAASAVALLFIACAVQVPEPPSNAQPVIDPDQAIADFVSLANRARLDAGCGTLAWHGDVAAVAQAHSEDMVARDYFHHVDRMGRTPMQRVQAATIPVNAVAENIAQGHQTGAAVLNGWLDSPDHRRNLLNCQYTHHGVGLAGSTWTHVLVRLAPRPR